MLPCIKVDVKWASPIIFDLGKKITTKISQKFKIFLLKSSGAGKKPHNFNRSQISQKLIFSGKPLNFKKNLIKFQHCEKKSCNKKNFFKLIL